MMNKPLIRNEKHLNRLSSNNQNMKRGGACRLKGVELIKAIKEAQKDPEFIREIKRFIKITTS